MKAGIAKITSLVLLSSTLAFADEPVGEVLNPDQLEAVRFTEGTYVSSETGRTFELRIEAGSLRLIPETNPVFVSNDCRGESIGRLVEIDKDEDAGLAEELDFLIRSSCSEMQDTQLKLRIKKNGRFALKKIESEAYVGQERQCRWIPRRGNRCQWVSIYNVESFTPKAQYSLMRPPGLPRPRNYTCSARNSQGRSFSSTGPSANQAQFEAMQKCRYETRDQSCSQMGCRSN